MLSLPRKRKNKRAKSQQNKKVANDLESTKCSFMAEVHVIGQVIGAAGFTDTGLSCKWKITFGDNWRLISGPSEGLTQLDYPEAGDIAYFCHPIDLHFLTSGLQGWPRFELEVWEQDSYRRTFLSAYGFIHVPSTPGRHQIECLTWKLVSSGPEEVLPSFSRRSALRLENTQILSDSLERYRLQTESSGKVFFEIFVIFRNLDRFGIESSV